MTSLAVAIHVRSLDQGLGDAARAAEMGADLVEFRIDRFTNDPSQVALLVERSALPCIVTCRPVWEGGFCGRDDADRVAALRAAVTAGAQAPTYIDVELATFQRSADLGRAVENIVDHPAQPEARNTGLILSAHDFDGRPANLMQKVEAMAAAPACRVIKVVWQARSLRDNLETFEVIRQKHKPTIALCMGQWGLPSRVLARKFGALLTYAALDDDGGTASGQPTVSELKSLFRWDAINAETSVFGVIGDPVAHSLGPAIHNAGFEAVGFNGVYLPLPIPARYEHFNATVDSWIQMADLHFRGASVTIPHKQNLLRFVADRGGQIEPLAEQIGAANTLTVTRLGDDGSLLAGNTDYAAALDAVCEGMGVRRDELQGVRVAVVGAGGVARAVVAGFASCGATVVVYNRTHQKAHELAERFNGSPGKVVAVPLGKICDCCCQVFINCTSIGMHPNVDATPIPSAAAMPGWGPGTVVFDTVYTPAQTRLLREARAAGCVVISGVEMFIRQAATQFKLWTGREAPLELFRRVVNEKLGG